MRYCSACPPFATVALNRLHTFDSTEKSNRYFERSLKHLISYQFTCSKRLFFCTGLFQLAFGFYYHTTDVTVMRTLYSVLLGSWQLSPVKKTTARMFGPN